MKLTRLPAALGGVTAAFALASAGYQLAGEARDRRRFPAPGRLVDVDGHRLHIRCTGTGALPVVIIPAMGGLAADWKAVQDALAADTAVCVYDRAGLGWSDAAPRWPTAVGMARELHALLDAAGVARPVVLAGHSSGGLVARVYTRMYPGEVAGLVLVDSSHPGQNARLPKRGPRSRRGGKLAEVALDFAWPLGLRRLKRDLSGQAADDRRAALNLSSRSRRAFAKELLAFGAVCRQAAAAPCDLGHLPLAVITSSERAPGIPDGSRAQRDRSRFYAGWALLQDELAALSTDSVHVVAPHAGHFVHRDDPELVVRTIAGLVRRVRQP